MLSRTHLHRENNRPQSATRSAAYLHILLETARIQNVQRIFLRPEKIFHERYSKVKMRMTRKIA